MTTEDWTFADYRLGDTVLPEPNLGWNMYGTGLESMGDSGAPEPMEIPEVAPDQLLIRIDAQARQGLRSATRRWYSTKQ